jgi:hypothetical protein
MSFRPTDEMARAARRGLDMRAQLPRTMQGGTAVGLARANQFANRELVSLDTVRRTYSFLSRAAGYYKPGSISPGTQAYLLWGGPAGLTWARNILRSRGE